jgi:septation ring formation regulator EzrA
MVVKHRVLIKTNQKVEELQKEITDNKVQFERNNTFSHKRILELEDKIERAKRILNDFVIQFDFGGSITAQRALINEARSILVLNQEKKEPYCFGKFDKKCEDCQSYCMYRGACENSSVANGKLGLALGEEKK